jgi:hypothetical protein
MKEERGETTETRLTCSIPTGYGPYQQQYQYQYQYSVLRSSDFNANLNSRGDEVVALGST